MSGRIFQLAKRDSKRIVTSGGFEETITISTATGSNTLTLTGLATKHHLNFNSDGLPINSKNVHICIDEDVLTAAGYPVRNAKGEVNLLKHRVSFPDNTGVIKNYVVNENFPDETLGLIVLILSDYKV